MDNAELPSSPDQHQYLVSLGRFPGYADFSQRIFWFNLMVVGAVILGIRAQKVLSYIFLRKHI